MESGVSSPRYSRIRVRTEAEDPAVAITVGPAGACDKDAHLGHDTRIAVMSNFDNVYEFFATFNPCCSY
jgi:hypothetical protein